jgi:hypothetical protein
VTDRLWPQIGANARDQTSPPMKLVVEVFWNNYVLCGEKLFNTEDVE